MGKNRFKKLQFLNLFFEAFIDGIYRIHKQTGIYQMSDYDSFYKSMDITIMGKRTFNEIKNMENIDSFYPTTKNYVFTHAESLSANLFLLIVIL